MTLYTLFGQPASPATLVVDTADYTLGVQFSVSQAATLAAIWFNSAAGAANLPGTIALFAVSGRTLVTSQAASWSGAAGSGWVRAAFTVPPSLTASTSYKAAVQRSNGGVGNWYSKTDNYWSSGPGSGGVANGPLSAPNNAGGDGGQDTFTQNIALMYPLSSFNAANYWIDPQVSVAAVQAPAAGGGTSMLRRGLMLADL